MVKPLPGFLMKWRVKWRIKWLSLCGWGVWFLPLSFLAACALPESRGFYSFMAFQEEDPGLESKSLGLNPLSQLPLCQGDGRGRNEGLTGKGSAGEEERKKVRVLIADPRKFSPESSVLVQKLWQAFRREAPLLEFQVASGGIQDEESAYQAGIKCQATAVIWEIPGGSALELLLPVPLRVPLDPPFPAKACVFGHPEERTEAIFLVLQALSQISEKNIEKAHGLLKQVRHIHDQCLKVS